MKNDWLSAGVKRGLTGNAKRYRRDQLPSRHSQIKASAKLISHALIKPIKSGLKMPKSLLNVIN